MSRLEPFKKDFYIPHPDVSDRPLYEVEEWRRKQEISLKGKVNRSILFFNGYLKDVCTYIVEMLKQTIYVITVNS